MGRKSRVLSRRTFLGGAGAMLALPWLEAMTIGTRAAYAGDSGFPTRFLLYFWGNGNLPEYWNPTGEGTEWELSDQLMPLADLKDKITVVGGMTVKVVNRVEII